MTEEEQRCRFARLGCSLRCASTRSFSLAEEDEPRLIYLLRRSAAVQGTMNNNAGSPQLIFDWRWLSLSFLSLSLSLSPSQSLNASVAPIWWVDLLSAVAKKLGFFQFSPNEDCLVWFGLVWFGLFVFSFFSQVTREWQVVFCE